MRGHNVKFTYVTIKREALPLLYRPSYGTHSSNSVLYTVALYLLYLVQSSCHIVRIQLYGLDP
jgi:hypothetical protein